MATAVAETDPGVELTTEATGVNTEIRLLAFAGGVTGSKQRTYLRIDPVRDGTFSPIAIPVLDGHECGVGRQCASAHTQPGLCRTGHGTVLR